MSEGPPAPGRLPQLRRSCASGFGTAVAKVGVALEGSGIRFLFFLSGVREGIYDDSSSFAEFSGLILP